jgi:hypothetical protein
MFHKTLRSSATGSAMIFFVQSLPTTCNVKWVRAQSKTQRLFFLLVIIGSFFVCAPAARALNLTLAWEPNASSEDVAGYKIYYGTESQNYTTVLDVRNATVKLVGNLKKGMNHYFAATAYNSSGVESSFSEEVMVNTCTYKLTPKKKKFKPTGGHGKVMINTQPNCKWTAESGNELVLIINELTNGTGKGYLMYSVNPNPDPETRIVDSEFAGMPFRVTQTGTSISK